MATYKPIQSTTLTVDTNSITLFGIDQAYSDLRVVISGTITSNNQGYRLQFNNDSSSGLYSFITMGSTSGGAASYKYSSYNFINTFIMNGTLSSSRSMVSVDVALYSDTSTYKSCIVRAGDANSEVQLIGGLWRSTAAVSSVTVYASSGNLTAGTTISLYGIKAGTPKAIGGNITTTDGTYWYHAFTSSGTFTVQQGTALTADVLTVAGGGAGFYGGGGAGGVVYTGSQSFLPTNYTVTVGAGGAAPDPISGTIPVSGSNSTVTGGINTSLVAIGGGGGGVYPTLPAGATGANGGSGGGAGVGTSGSPTQSGGSPTSGQGFRGGNTNSTNSAAGGGGAGAAGADMSGSSSSGTNGGAGVNTYSSWLSATGLGVSGYIAGGGGGRGFDGRGSGGSGGGGNGDRANVTSGSAGTANTGGGGGGGYSFSPNGWAGGSGLVIVRYSV